MFLCDVMVSNGMKLLIDQPGLTRDPTGYDSILGEVGMNLNDEVMVYNEAAVLPKNLIIKTV
jgi:hypothetical protein